MKPSEYLIKEGYWIISDMPNTKLEDGEGYRVDSVADELDNKFIDREELKDKIKKVLDNNFKIWEIKLVKEINGIDSYEIKDIEYYKLKKEILELIDK